MEEGRLVQTIDSRFPTCTYGDKLTAQVTAALGSGAQLQDCLLYTSLPGSLFVHCEGAF